MKTELDQLLDDLEKALDQAAPHIVVAPHREALARLREQAGKWTKIQENVGAIRSEIIDPVNAQLATGNRLSLRGFWVGLGSAILGTALSIGLFYLSSPIESSRDIDSIDSRLKRLEVSTRDALSQRPGLLSGSNYEAVEGEIIIGVGERKEVLTGDPPLVLRLVDVTTDSFADGKIIRLAKLDLFTRDGRQFSGEGLNRNIKIDGPFPDRRETNETRFFVSPGDTLTILGHEFEITKVFITEPIPGREVSDPVNAVFLVERE